MKNFTWQPKHNGPDNIVIYLDRIFAYELINTTTSKENQNKIQNLADELIDYYGYNRKNTIRFHKDTLFLEER